MTRKILWLAIGVGAAVAIILLSRPAKRVFGPLRHDAYIWQRLWNQPVLESIAAPGSNFTELIPLAAEITWHKGQPQVVYVPLDYPALRRTRRPIGLALRIGTFDGPFRENDERAIFLTQFAAELIAEAVTNELQVAELQVDFDCADSKLDGYRVWVDAMRKKATPVPLTITALPSWLKRRAFKHLIASTDGYVLQVHSLQRPKAADASFVLCDPKAAQRAVEKAARLGKPFRVALPTYGYLAAFDGSGHFVGISAEGPAPVWTNAVEIREIRTDPAAMAALVQGWRNDRPEALKGIIWYRLPIAGENLNWAWPTLSMVMAGAVPHSDLRAEARYPRPALVEIDLMNLGTADHLLPVQLTLRWRGARLVASDALQGFESLDDGLGSISFKSKVDMAPFGPGERRTIGWVRFNQRAEVTLDLAAKHD